MTPDEFDRELDLFYGGANANRVTVYARLPIPPDGDGWTLSGTVRGPHCLYSTTLPATLRLTDAGPGPTLLAKALVPDPCYWSPELPFLYDMHVELKQGAEVVVTADRLLGIRDFGPRGRFLYDQGKRRVIRGATNGSQHLNLLDWHDAPLALVVEAPSDALCDEASRSGVMIVAMAGSGDVSSVATARRLARHASVAVLYFVPAPSRQVLPQLRAAAPNLMFAIDVWSVEEADCMIAPLQSDETLAIGVARKDLPLIALELVSHGDSPAELRLACDRLQAKVARQGDFAGYLVVRSPLSN